MAKIDSNSKKRSDLRSAIEKATEGMFYLSETDAEISPFFGGSVETTTLDTILRQHEIENMNWVEEVSFDFFFSRLTQIKDWFGDKERENTVRFGHLKKLLETNLTDLKVYRIGKIRIDIYVVGIDEEGNLAGVKTMAVET